MKRFVALCLMAVALATAPAFSDFQDGLNAFERGDYKTALREWQPLAEQGNAGAQFFLGFIYEIGEGVPQDYKQAVKWYTLSAKQGDKEAQNSLGLMYENGQGVMQDYKEAEKWFRLSAEHGYVRAHFNLGFSYATGQGVPQDYVLAHMWFNLAASNGDETAATTRDKVAEEMTPSQIEKAQDLARACIAKDYKGC